MKSASKKLEEYYDKRRIVRIYYCMKARCHNKNDQAYRNYGGRGIQVCDEWRRNRDSFIAWALSSGYQNDLSIDRINNDLGYSPENCKWSSTFEQARNRRNTVYHTINGIKKPLIDWCVEMGLDFHMVTQRIYRGSTVEQALSGPRVPKYTTGQKRPGAKLDEDAIRFIRKHRGAMTLKQLSEKFGVVTSVIHRIQVGTKWKHVS